MEFSRLYDPTTNQWRKPVVSAQKVADQLKVSRHYVQKNIQPFVYSVRQVSKSNDATIYFDKEELCKWLMENATFSRQTWRFKEGDPEPQKGNYEPKLIPYRRNKVMTIPVLPFDFWDLPLIFPKDYHRPFSGKVSSAELCYRDMFKAGAIKIQLGTQKTMFYIPGLDSNDPKDVQAWADLPFDDPEHPLFPATWLPSKNVRKEIIESPEYRTNKEIIGNFRKTEIPDQSYRLNLYGPMDGFLYKGIIEKLRKVFVLHQIRRDIHDSQNPYEDKPPYMSLEYEALLPADFERQWKMYAEEKKRLEAEYQKTDKECLDDLVKHAERYMPPAKIDATSPEPIDDDPESYESIESLVDHADQYFQPGDDIEYYDPNHDWYVQNWEGEDIPGTSCLKIEDNDDRTDK